MKSLTERMQAGIRAASKQTHITPRQASLKAGFNQNQLLRFLTGQTGIKIQTLDDICNNGFGLTFNQVWILGGKLSEQ